MDAQPDGRTVRRIVGPLVAGAGNWRRMANALTTAARFIGEGRCAFVDGATVRVYSDSGESYLTSLTDCVNEGSGETCPAWAAAMPCKHRAALHILLKANQGDEGGEHECCACRKKFHAERLMPVNMAALRAGEIVPSGVCPLCGFFCFPLGRVATAA